MISKIITKIKDEFKSTFTLKNLMLNVFEALVVILGMFSFLGKYIIGYNINPIFFIVVIICCITYFIYKRICFWQDYIEDIKKNNKKKGRK